MGFHLYYMKEDDQFIFLTDKDMKQKDHKATYFFDKYKG